ncbi:microfibril-associated glycoprotein 4-like isoform X2 [Pocillopora verrucosa]
MQFKFSLQPIISTLYIFHGIILPPCICCTDDDYRNIIFKDPIPNMTMKNHTIISVEVPNEGSCRVMCYMEPNCVSINIGPVAGGNQKCELNNATEENHAPFLLVKNPGYTYLAIENLCSSSPCLNNGTCQAGFTNKGFRCVCQEKFTGETCQVEVKRNCAEIYKSAGKPADGVYPIKPDNLPAFDVFCDQTTEGGGWTVFQKRLDGSVDFYRYWNDYKRGFGDLCGEFWLGLDKIHRLTSDDNNTLRVDFEDFEGNTAYAEYNLFGVMSEKDKYKLILGSYSGNSGDSLAFHRGMPFTTRDQENDDHVDHNCAIKFKGAWWYKECHRSNLNGLYLRGNHSTYADGVNWHHWKGHYYSLKRTEMKIRPKDF